MPAKLQGQYYRINDTVEKKLIDAFVDVNRRDSRIIEDFKEELSALRRKYPVIKKTSPRIQDWHLSRILETWDLREYNVSWSAIVEVLSSNIVDTNQQARNSYNTAKNYIDQEKYITLVKNFI